MMRGRESSEPGGKCWLLIDQGGHASRAFVLDERGSTVAAYEAPLETRRPRQGWVEHDPEALLSSVRTVVLGALGNLPPGARVCSAALATQRSSIVCWDRVSAKPLSPVLSWQDRRNADWLESLRGHESRIRELTGLPLSAHYGASKMRWCLDSLPAVQAAAADGRLMMAPLASYLAHGLLTQRPLVADPANASRTLLWDFQRQDWSGELLELFGIPSWALPGCVPTRHEFGNLEAGAHAVPLQLITGDQSAAAFCAGTSDPGTAFINVGTGAFLQIFTDRIAPPELGMLSSVIYSDRDGVRRVLEGTVNGAGSALEWQSSRDGVSMDFVRENSQTWLEQVRDPPLFLNGVGGLGSPFWRPDFTSRFIGHGDASARMVAVMESILFLLRINLETVVSVQAVQKLVVTGGLSNLDPLCERLANLLMLPVHRPGFSEATVLGLYRLLRMNHDLLGPAEGRDFQPAHDPALEARFQAWRRAMAVALEGAAGAGT
jgi:glycerol kinase